MTVGLLFKAIIDNRLSDAEFQVIFTELEQYHLLKEKVRAKLTRQSSGAKPVDVEKIRKTNPPRD